MIDVSIAQLEEMLVSTGNEDDDWLPLVKVRRETTGGGTAVVRFRFLNVDGTEARSDLMCVVGDAVNWSIRFTAKP